jgi:SHS2 domain-containing protein
VNSPDNLPAWLEPMEHTADRGIIVRAAGLPQLYERAAWGMFSLITDLRAVRPVVESEVLVGSTDREGLLVRWLSELNRRHQTEGVLYCVFHVRQLSDERLAARVRGEAIDTARHTLDTEIKGVTFHALKIEGEGMNWTAQVLFDT